MSWLWWIGVALAGPQQDLASQLQQTWQEVHDDAQWRSPYAAERSALREVATLLGHDAEHCDDPTLKEAKGLLAATDFQLEVMTEGDERILVVREGREKRGAGLFAMRCGPAEPLVWQAPHSLHDQKTGAIARILFAQGNARAVMWNTVHRYRSTPKELKSDPVHPADVTREQGSLFQAVTVGLAVGDPALRFAQVHGFAQASAPYQVIVSTGDPQSPPEAVATALQPVLGKAAAYGQEIESLGGTVNVQGEMLRDWPTTRFLHVELSPDARTRLATDGKVRARFAKAVSDTEW